MCKVKHSAGFKEKEKGDLSITIYILKNGFENGYSSRDISKKIKIPRTTVDYTEIGTKLDW